MEAQPHSRLFARGKAGQAGNDAALPRGGKGQGGCTGTTLFAPAGQRRCRVGAPDFGLSRGKVVCGAVCPSRVVGRRAGGQKQTILRSMGPPSPRNHPAGGTAGSARTRSRVQTLENPFWGDGSRFPAAPVPKTPQAAGPCSWARRRLLAPPPQPERNAERPPPARGAGVRRPRANGYWLPAQPASAAWSCVSVCASGAWKTTLASAARATSMSGVTPWPWMERPEGV